MKTKFSDLKNKNIIITGGNGFLGRQISQAFIDQGAKVFILDVYKSEIKNETYFLKTDITKENHLKKTLDYLKKKKVKIDVLINSAARDYVPNAKNKKNNNLKLENFSEKIWTNDVNVGLKGSFLTTKIFGSYMAKNKGGVILNISSDLGIVAPNQEIYKSSGFIKPISY